MNVPTNPLFGELQQELAQTEEPFRCLFPPNLPPWPIPFFGQLFEAEIVTVGVNPSCGEFEENRWSGINSLSQAEERLIAYFTCKTPPPHSWFDTWETALNKIDASYYPNEKYRAAHIDLSPRVTYAMGDVESELFIEMVRNDLFCFLRFLNLAPHARLLLMAGSVTGDYYLNQFLAEHLPAGRRLQGSFNPRSQPGPGKVAFHWLETSKRSIPAFFCSCSPSDRENRDLLIKRVEAELAGIRKHGSL